MGRRKERRFAAISAAGRRVKLDLLAEPSGDVSRSFPLEKVEGDGDSKSHAKLPSSPSSSGQQLENPLLLLEQYSDGELVEGSSGHNHAVTEDASTDVDEEGKISAGKETNSEINHVKESIRQFLMDNASASQDPWQVLEKGSITETGGDDLQEHRNKMEETTSPAAPDEHPVGDVSSCWKMVLYEESNQYYYWNIATGETSWEVPDVLAQEYVMTSTEQIIENTEGKMDAIVAACRTSTPLSMEGNTPTRNLKANSMVNRQNSGGADQRTNRDGSNDGIEGESIEDEEGNRDASQRNGTFSPGGNSEESNRGNELTDLSSQLIKHYESLLKGLNTVKCLNCHQEDQEFKMKCRVEIETRLTDIKALASHGLALLPFWLHSECQIKRLEAALEDFIQRNNPTSLGEFEATLVSREGIVDDTEVGITENRAQLTVLESHAEQPIRKSSYEANNDGVTTTEHLSLVWYSSNYPVSDVGGTNEIPGTGKESELAPRPALYSAEDIDMDVDMEVDDTSSVKSPHEGASGAHCFDSTELSNVHYTLTDQASTVPGEAFSVAPPGEEWIPPPPPDEEPIPPPPPDDGSFPSPPDKYHPVSHLGSVQPFPYSEQYTLSYPGSNLEYYGQANLEVPGSVPYTHPERGKVAVPHLPHYYEAAANIYAVAPVIVNPVEPTTYYGLQIGIRNPVSLISGVAEPSCTLSEPVPETLDSGTAGSVDYHPEAGSKLLMKTNFNVVKSGDAAVKASSEVPESPFSIGAQATSSVGNGVCVSSTSDTTAAAAAATAAAATSKSQSKVPRGEKRTVAVVSTLRSNKKVSSLVDKWKAAKEELDEEEEGPKDAYEILERKRQREIEEWRAQQIASGEAKNNANFQPLGGDWRERVKRKRAQRMKESRQSSADVATDGNQQTDLVELSKGLPSGWQVCWDDSTKQVYYGNVRTSETTWTRPTD